MRDRSRFLRLFRREAACRVLGPGLRAVLWVQGCPLACPGCLVPEARSARGPEVPVAEVAEWVLGCRGLEGLTLSGGEPMAQAGALVALVDRVRARRDLGVVCYTGKRLEDLRGRQERELLRRVDLLIDGPYRAEEHADLLWRGSANQRLVALTPRYQAYLPPAVEDRGAGLEFRFEARGAFTFAGVPPWPGYLQQLAGGVGT